MYLNVGLGNPRREYDDKRINMGLEVIDTLVEE